MSEQNGKSAFVKAVTNEGVLAFYRTICTLGTLILVFYVNRINSANDEIKKDISDLKYSMAQDVGRANSKINVIDAKVDAVSDRVNAQARRIDGNDSDIRETNKRINDVIIKRTLP